MSDRMADMLEAAYQTFDDSPAMAEYASRHKIDSAAILTVYDDETADLIALRLADRIRGRVVVEIGAGLGLLACHLAQHAFKVYAIEANPIWASCFAVALLRRKPKNVTYILGAADEMVGVLHADVALFCTHSGADSMRRIGEQFAPVVIDVHGEVLTTLKTDPAMMALRNISTRPQPPTKE